MKIRPKPNKIRPDSLPNYNTLFAALIIADILAPFFIWPHWAGRFYPGWAAFFSAGLAHWLQSLALILAWPLWRDKLWGRLGLVLAAGLHLFCPPPTLDDQRLSALAAAGAWWLAALPALAAARGQWPALPDSGARQFRDISWLALAANLILLLTMIHLPLTAPGQAPDMAWAALRETGVFLAFPVSLLLAGRSWRLFSAPVYLAALISLGGLMWLGRGLVLTEAADLEAFRTGLLAIHITLLPALGGAGLAAALLILALRRRGGFRGFPAPIRPGWLLALALTPLAGLGLAAIPLRAGQFSHSLLEPPPASGPVTLMAAGPLNLPIPASLAAADWPTLINWADQAKETEADDRSSSDRYRPWRETHGMILIETEYSHPSLAESEFEEAWQNLQSRASDRPGCPQFTDELSEQFGRPSRLLVFCHRPRHSAKNEEAMIMRLNFWQRHQGGYIRLLESVKLRPEDIGPGEIDGFREEKRASFLSRAGEAAAAYRWGQRPELSDGGMMFRTRFGRLDHGRIRAELELRLRLAKAGEAGPGRRRPRDGTDIWIKSGPPGAGSSRPAPDDRPEPGPAPEAPGRRASERLEPLLGRIKAERLRSVNGRSGLERIRISTGGRDNSPASLTASWASFDGTLEVEMRSDRRLVQAEIPALTRLWSDLLESGNLGGGS